MQVTIYKNLYKKSASDANTRPIAVALKRIQEGASKDKIDKIRSGEKEFKMSLPVVLFSGEFRNRQDNDLVRHSGFIVLDFDHIDIAKSKPLIGTDPYIYACWISPSGDGIKALSRISNPERHRDHFKALVAYFKKQYDLEVDASGINESRACYESYDPDIIINEESSVFGAFQVDSNQEQVAVSQSDSYTDYFKLNLAAKMIRQAADGEKHNTLLRAGRLCGGYVAAGRMEEDEVIRVLAKMIRQAADGEKHNTLLRAGRLCGGYVAAGRMEEDEVIRVLTREILKRDVDDEEHTVRTLREAVDKGKEDPITVTIQDEKKARRELLINDGDMSFISSDDEDFRWIDDFANGKIPVGLDTGDAELDKFF